LIALKKEEENSVMVAVPSCEGRAQQILLPWKFIVHWCPSFSELNSINLCPEILI
jgi:hypothetical protein